MKMPVHSFILLGNILADQFKEEAKKQEEQDKEMKTQMPNLANFNPSSFLGSSSMPSMPSMPSF